MPPVLKDQPPVAGAIMWCRSLFQRIKGTVLRFQTMKDLFDSEKGKEVSCTHTHTHTHLLILIPVGDTYSIYWVDLQWVGFSIIRLTNYANSLMAYYRY